MALTNPSEDDLLGMFAFFPGFLLPCFMGPALVLAERFDFLAPPYHDSPLGLSAALFEGPFPPRERGGWRLSLRLWSTHRVFAHYGLVVDFMKRVAGVEAYRCFITDGLTLWDLHRGPSNAPYFERTYEIYGVDISDIDPPYLWAIAARIQDNRLH